VQHPFYSVGDVRRRDGGAQEEFDGYVVFRAVFREWLRRGREWDVERGGVWGETG